MTNLRIYRQGRNSFSFIHSSGMEIILIAGKRRARIMKSALLAADLEDFWPLRELAFAARPPR